MPHSPKNDRRCQLILFHSIAIAFSSWESDRLALAPYFRLFLDTALVIYFVERNPEFVDRVDPILERLESETVRILLTTDYSTVTDLARFLG